MRLSPARRRKTGQAVAESAQKLAGDQHEAAIKVCVVLALPEHQLLIHLETGPACSARQAVLLAEQQGLKLAEAGLAAVDVPIGIFGRQVKDDQILESGDRVEVYRPLQQDPKEWRRQRAASKH